MATTITYETKPCGRCGGSGHYSFNQVHGTKCFGCSGTKRALTPAAKKARAAIAAFIAERHTVGVETLVAGDRVKYDGYTRTLASVTRDGAARYGSTVDGVTTWRDGFTITFTKSIPTAFGPCASVGCCEGQTFIKAVAGADWEKVVAFARTIKKGVVLIEKAA